MNLMYLVLSQENFNSKNEKINKKVDFLRKKLKTKKIKFENKSSKIGNVHYYKNSMPYISDDRDVLVKPDTVFKIRVNWKQKPFTGLSVDEISNILKPQWAFNFITVDAEHTRNKFKNKDLECAVFDSEKEALEYLKVFNSLFITAIEQDAIEEYKKFKENPDKRPLTFDKLVSNYAELYEAVDNNEL